MHGSRRPRALAAAMVVWLHATLVSSEPAANAVLAASPSQIRLVFSEPIEPRLGAMVLVNGHGDSRRLTTEADPHDVHVLIARVQSLPPDSYRLTWRIVSADGHPVSGSYAFAVAEHAPSAAESPSIDEPAAIRAPPVDRFADREPSLWPTLW